MHTRSYYAQVGAEWALLHTAVYVTRAAGDWPQDGSIPGMDRNFFIRQHVRTWMSCAM